jgi:hypothetical protein
MDMDEHLALMPLQQAMREAGMRRDFQVPRLTGQLQLQLGQQIGGWLLEFMNKVAQRLGVSGAHRDQCPVPPGLLECLARFDFMNQAIWDCLEQVVPSVEGHHNDLHRGG